MILSQARHSASASLASWSTSHLLAPLPLGMRTTTANIQTESNELFQCDILSDQLIATNKRRWVSLNILLYCLYYNMLCKSPAIVRPLDMSSHHVDGGIRDGLDKRQQRKSAVQDTKNLGLLTANTAGITLTAAKALVTIANASKDPN